MATPLAVDWPSTLMSPSLTADWLRRQEPHTSPLIGHGGLPKSCILGIISGHPTCHAQHKCVWVLHKDAVIWAESQRQIDMVLVTSLPSVPWLHKLVCLDCYSLMGHLGLGRTLNF